MFGLSVNKKYSYYHLLVWGWFGLIFLLDALFFRQRIVGDTAYYLFRIVQDQDFVIEHGRPLSVVSQWIPVLLVKAHAPMDWVMWAYSINEWLYYFILFIILEYWIKNRGAVIALILSMILLNKENWYNPVSELIQGGALLIVTLAWIQKKLLAWWEWLLIAALIPLMVLSHPLQFLLIPMGLMIVYINKDRPDWKRLIVFGMVTVGCIAYKYLRFDYYENQSLIWDALNTDDILYRKKRFLAYLFTHYTGLGIIFLLTVVYAFRANMYRAILLIIVLLLGFTAFILYKTGNLIIIKHETFERYMYPISIVMAFAFGAWVWNKFHEKRVIRWILLILLLFELVCWWGLRMPDALKRKAYLHAWMTYLSQFPEQKLFQRYEHFAPYDLGLQRDLNWSMTNESSLISASLTPNHTQQLNMETFGDRALEPEVKTQADRYYYSTFWLQNASDFNANYFSFRPGRARMLNTDSMQSHLPDSFFQKIDFEIDFPIMLFSNQTYYQPILIKNPHPTPIYSGQKHEYISLSYAWEKDGKIVIRDGIRTRLAADVIGSMPQLMTIVTPPHAGNYTLVVDLVYDGVKWCHIDRRFEVKVW